MDPHATTPEAAVEGQLTGNVESKLPDALAATVAAKMRAAYRNPDPLAAEADLYALARQLTKPTPAPQDPCARGWPRR